MGFHFSVKYTDANGQGIAQIRPCIGCGALLADRARCSICTYARDTAPTDDDRLRARRELIAYVIAIIVAVVCAIGITLHLAWRLDAIEAKADACALKKGEP